MLCQQGFEYTDCKTPTSKNGVSCVENKNSIYSSGDLQNVVYSFIAITPR